MRHDGFWNGSYVFIADVDIIKFSHVFDGRGVAIDINGFVELREFARDDETEICGRGIIIADWKLRNDVADFIVDVVEHDSDIAFCHALDDVLILFGNVVMQNVHLISAVGGSAVDHRTQRNAHIRDKAIVAAKEYRNDWFSCFAHRWGPPYRTEHTIHICGQKVTLMIVPFKFYIGEYASSCPNSTLLKVELLLYIETFSFHNADHG